MQVNEYQDLAMRTLNPELNKRDVLINSVMGLCGESGEAIDIVKKWMAHGHELDKAHLAQELGLDLEDILTANIEKLKNRYPDGFSCERSRTRLKGDL